jgi:hypothetical protein
MRLTASETGRRSPLISMRRRPTFADTRRVREATPDGFRIETPSLLIRRFTLADAPAVFRLSQEESYRVWLPSQVYADRAVADHALEFLIGQYSEPGDPRLGPYASSCRLRVRGRSGHALPGLHAGREQVFTRARLVSARRHRPRGVMT